MRVAVHARLIGGKDKPDDVVLVAYGEPGTVGFVDDVVGRGHDLREVGDLLRVVAGALERGDVGHGSEFS